MPKLTDDMRALIQATHLCFAATVTPDGRPNLSPKGTIRVFDDASLCFLDIASPGTKRNLASNPWMELNVVDTLSRRGYRFRGRARLCAGDTPEFAKALEILARDDTNAYPADGAVILAVEFAAPLRSPGYLFVGDERTMRANWRARREALDAELDAFLARR